MLEPLITPAKKLPINNCNDIISKKACIFQAWATAEVFSCRDLTCALTCDMVVSWPTALRPKPQEVMAHRSENWATWVSQPYLALLGTLSRRPAHPGKHLEAGE